ncbi:MAG: type I methionyl aminopeptidase [Candidatus Taylorbacteria bacterium CG11_big_fil_rev_8_21_14_0_20_46_11]|uniref:Methionine aminopeptidase n=1 Tax=Candidatus Taylorbacteria bacterium CG11_big_fil_rev_8_21_14_0_20_46_11 TaxID=1975025 RepID=A0A2H0KD35_9BACT|nr:MAG: type I methionyl aminopeptidase [Candidatus Taylorbacteria bacterium CG11_big_fil_rev_8_21_14_0_20_46_11]
MGITIKAESEIKILREGGKRLAEILRILSEAVRPGISSFELSELTEKLIKEGGDTSSFLGYTPQGAKRPYPASLCFSVNDAVVHGIPNETETFLKEGDIVSLDCSIVHKGLVTDSAVTVAVGEIGEDAQKLLRVTREALNAGISVARAGNTIGDIGFAIQSFVAPYGYGIVRELSGHGVGYKIHEEPYVPNFGKKGEGPILKKGMVIAIEPMVNEGKASIKLDSDGYTYRTRDGKRSAHFEHTVAITSKGAEILTTV